MGRCEVNVFQPVCISGDNKRGAAQTMERIRAAVVNHDVATAQEADAIIRDMHAFAAASKTLVAYPRIVQVWGSRNR